MKALFWYELRLNRRFLLSLAAGIGLFTLVMALIAPSIQETLAQAMRIVPAFLRPLLGDRLQVQGLAGVLSIVYTHPIWLTLLGAWAVGYGARAIAGDVETGKLGLMLAYPVSRTQVLAAKALTLFAGIFLLVLVTLLATAVGLAFQQEALSAGGAGYAWTAIGMLLLFGCIGGVAFACSALSREAGRALGFALAFAVGQYFIDAIGQFWKTAEPYRVASIFKQYDPRALLQGLPPEASAWLYLGGVMILSLAIAWFAFNRRDLAL